MCTAPVSEGDILAGRYRVERVLGVGGMGVVVAAVHVQLGQRVAVKFLRSEICQHPGIGARFLREARAAARIQSEHVGRVIDFGTLDSGAPYMVMEFLSGADLSQLLRAGPCPSIEQAVEYILQACEGIAEAHALGVVHRDIKPANLFVTRRSDGSPLVKVLDFGISKAKDDDASVPAVVTMTTTGAVLGSPAYMSPEQVRNAKDIDGRTDIWALGVVLYELLTGRPVYQADTLSALLAMIAADPPPPLGQCRADVPLELERIVLRCLNKNRDERFADVGELALALRPFGPQRAALHAERSRSVLGSTGAPALGDTGAAAVSADLQGSAHGDSVPASVMSRHQATARLERQRQSLVLGAVAVLGLGSVGLVFGLDASRKRPVPTVALSAATATAQGSAEMAVQAVTPEVTPVPAVAVSAAVPVASNTASVAPPVAPKPPTSGSGALHREPIKTKEPPKRDPAAPATPAPATPAPATPAPATAPPAATPGDVPPRSVVTPIDRGANPF